MLVPGVEGRLAGKFREKLADRLARDLHEDAVRLDRVDDLEARKVAHGVGEVDAMAFAWLAFSRQRSPWSSASNWAERKRIFEASWPSCLRTNSNPSASSGRRKTTESPNARPFLVAPNETTSTPQSVVSA